MIDNTERIACLSAPGADFQPVLRSVHATGKVNGLMFRMRLKQLYQNVGEKELETIYSFPLAWGTTLLGMRVTLNGKEMSGVVIEKKLAENKYEDAISSGDLPVMLVRESRDIYSARLGNLKPGDEASVEIEYGQMLHVEQGQIRVNVPTTIAPRFGRDPGLSGLAAHAVGALDPLAEHRFHLSLDICGPLAKADISSPSHAVAQRSTDGGVCVEISHRSVLDRDFILRFSGLDNLIICTASAEPAPVEGFTLLTGFVHSSGGENPVPKKTRLKFLVDCSGSMAGDGMRLARQGLKHAIGQLLPEDRVSFSRFGSTVVHVRQHMTSADDKTIKYLLERASGLKADLGGTELDRALREVIDIPGLDYDESETSERCAIFLVTDGEVWDIDNIVRTARASGHVIYAVGVGSAPAESLLRQLAEVSGGGCELIAPNENINAAVTRLFSKLREATELEISIEVDGEPSPLAPISRCVTPGEMVQLWCQLERRPAVPPRLRIRQRGSDAIQLIEPLGIEWGSDSALARMAAAQRLLDESGEQRIKDIALHYQLVTEHSSFFLVHERAELEKAGSVPEFRQIGNMMAAGWGGAGTVFKSYRMPADACFDLPSMADSAQVSRFMPVESVHSPVAWPHESLSSAVRYSGNSNIRHDSSLAKAVGSFDETNNPLRELVQFFVSANGAPDALALTVYWVRDSSSSKMLQSVLDDLRALFGSEEEALAVLLDWTIQRISAASVSRRCLRPVNEVLSRLSADSQLAARTYLDTRAAKPADPLPVLRRIFRLPGFLRRHAE